MIRSVFLKYPGDLIKMAILKLKVWGVATSQVMTRRRVHGPLFEQQEIRPHLVHIGLGHMYGVQNSAEVIGITSSPSFGKTPRNFGKLKSSPGALLGRYSLWRRHPRVGQTKSMELETVHLIYINVINANRIWISKTWCTKFLWSFVHKSTLIKQYNKHNTYSIFYSCDFGGYVTFSIGAEFGVGIECP